MTSSRSLAFLGSGLLFAIVLLCIAAALREPLPLPVVAHFGGAAVPLATVQATAAVLVPPVLVAAVVVLRAAGRLPRTAVPWALGAAAPIVLFLVARLNNIAEVPALVLVYASTAGGVLLRSLHRPGAGPAAIRWSAVLGIVPWGVVAFSQVGGLLTGTPPSAAVRVLTVAVLIASIAEYVMAYRRRDDPPGPVIGLVLAALPSLLLAALVIFTVR